MHFLIIQKKGEREMRLLRGIFIVIAIGILLCLSTTHTVAQEKEVMIGIVKSIEGRMLMNVEDEKTKSLVTFRIGRKTVYTPRRYPAIGERVKVEYLPHRGNLVAFTVTIMGSKE